ncbi:MAG: hypothetical protein H6Q33_2930 [Deltaproteobacteria bacterium]|nr:hypothetical protein [Deltaproteobacteria bacterium]
MRRLTDRAPSGADRKSAGVAEVPAGGCGVRLRLGGGPRENPRNDERIVHHA